MLARLPLVRVPLESFGPSGGRQQSLVLPIIPGMSDAELLEHVSFVKHVSFVTPLSMRRISSDCVVAE